MGLGGGGNGCSTLLPGHVAWETQNLRRSWGRCGCLRVQNQASLCAEAHGGSSLKSQDYKMEVWEYNHDRWRVRVRDLHSVLAKRELGGWVPEY